MTTISTTCGGCGRQLAVPARHQGRDLTCPSCGRVFRVSPPEASPRVEPAPLQPAPTSKPAPSPALEPFGAASAAPPEPVAFDEIGAAAVYWRVKRVGLVSAGLTTALIGAVLGLLVGLAAFVPSIPTSALKSLRGTLVGARAIAMLPIVYGLIGFVGGVLMACLYNLAARLVGGVRLLLD